MDASIAKPVVAVEWIGGVDGHLRLLDQTRLPHEGVVLELTGGRGVDGVDVSITCR